MTDAPRQNQRGVYLALQRFFELNADKDAECFAL